MVEKVVASAYNEQAARVYNWDFPGQKWINFSPTHKTSNMKIVERNRQLYVKIEPGGTDERFEFNLPQDVQVTKTGDMIQFAVPDKGDKTGGKLIAIKFNDKSQEDTFTRRASTKIPGFELPIQAAPQTGQAKPPPESLSSAVNDHSPPVMQNRQRIETFAADRHGPSTYQPPILPKNQQGGRLAPNSGGHAPNTVKNRSFTEVRGHVPNSSSRYQPQGDRGGGYHGNEGRKSPLNNLDASLPAHVAPPTQAPPTQAPPTNQPPRQDWTPVPKGSGYHDNQKPPDQSYGYCDNRPPSGDRYYDNQPRDRYHGDKPPSGERYHEDRPPSGERYHGDRPPSGERYHGNRPPSGERYHDDRPNQYNDGGRYRDDGRFYDNQRSRQDDRRDYRDERREDRDGFNDRREDRRDGFNDRRGTFDDRREDRRDAFNERREGGADDFRQRQEPYPGYHPNERNYQDNDRYDDRRGGYHDNNRRVFPEDAYDGGRRNQWDDRDRRERRDDYYQPAPPKRYPVVPSVKPLIKPLPTAVIEDDEELIESSKHLAHSLSQCNQSDSVQLVEYLISLLSEKAGGSDIIPGSFSVTFQGGPKPVEKTLNLIVQVEPLSGLPYSVYLEVKPSDTIEKLKQECFKKFKIYKECQHWVVGSKLAEDRHTMNDLQIIDNSTLFLYVQHPHKAKVHKSDMKEVKTISAKKPAKDDFPRQGPPEGYPLEHPTQAPPINRQASPTNQKAPPNDQQAVFRDSGDVLQHKAPPPFGGVQVMPVAQRVEEPPIFNDNNIMVLPPPPPDLDMPLPPLNDAPPPVEEEEPPHWVCLACTYKNLPFRPVCDVCLSGRPDDYLPPANYIPTDEERKFIGDDGLQKVNDLLDRERQEQEEQARRNYLALINTDAVPIVTNEEEFECPVCFEDIDPGDGIRLRGCLHMVCKGCLKYSVIHSEEAEVKCPHNGDDGECNEAISQREIREVLSEEELEMFFGRGLRQAEATDPKSFHCKTSDCKGFCFYEDEVNEFRCQNCGHTNCILCKAQHEDMNCQEYQDDIKLKAANDEAARQTQEMLEKMVTDGEAMHCPNCKVIVTKKVGCDWIRCVMCRTEMCWATKGPRWGPKGKYDTTGGCRCNINGKKCHPQCRNCH